MATESSTIVQRLWNYCNILRNDGIPSDDYLEQQLSVVEKQEQAVEPNLLRSSRLRQAILTRAVEGKLIQEYL